MHTYTIHDEDLCGAIKLSSAAYSVGEAGPMATITVMRIGGGSGAASERDLQHLGRDGNGGQRLHGGHRKALEWLDGDKTSQTFTVTILPDTLDEPNETIGVSLVPTELNCAILGSPVKGTVTILDNDPTPKVQFSQPTADVPEETAPANTAPPSDNNDSRSAAVIAANDFDGDGRSDYGVFDASSGLWSLRLSTDGDVAVQLGSAGSIPITGDFDGDGVTDSAATRLQQAPGRSP